MTDIGDDGLAGLTAALAKAQAAYPALLRDKEVDSRSYKFKYAPLDAVLEAVRGPLSKNGLAISQLLDGDDLVTLLLHDGGGRLEGRVPLPYKQGDTIQALGSAITYMRRYALQAILGIAAEEDDDGDRASKAGAVVAAAKPEPSVREAEGGLIGVAALGRSAPVDGQIRDELVDGHAMRSIGFVIGEGRDRVQVIARGKLADDLAVVLPAFIGQRVQVYGPVTQEFLPPSKSGYVHKFLRVGLVQIKTDDWVLPRVEAPTVPLFPDEAA